MVCRLGNEHAIETVLAMEAAHSLYSLRCDSSYDTANISLRVGKGWFSVLQKKRTSSQRFLLQVEQRKHVLDKA